ncbi:MAG: endolytic transglycosylase MltG [Clostridia bacterium]|nr:endolytic transglycosylase MltG [Clostridia bacterium]
MKEINDLKNQKKKEKTVSVPAVSPRKPASPASSAVRKNTAAPKTPSPAKGKSGAPKPSLSGVIRRSLAKKSSETRAIPSGADTAPKPRKPVSKAATRPPKKPVSKEDAAYKRAERVSLASTFVVALIYIGVVVGISTILSICGIRWANDIFALAKEEVVATVSIPENATVSEVSTILKDGGLIEYPAIFRAWVNFKNRDSETPLAFKTGEYELRSTLNYDQMVSKIRDRKARGIVKITIPEGYTVDEIIALFVAQGMGTREGFVDAINNYDYKNYTFMEKLKEIELSPSRKYRLEGYLFPDTYEFYADSGEVAIIDKMLAAFDSRFEKDYYARLDELGMNLDQVITLASIVQKEGKFSADFYPVAGTFYNRLNSKNMQRLQSDATVQYCLPERKAELSYADLEIDNPYNTYRNAGLPPSAISNPGWEAIQAALYPEQNKYYFFISDTDGSMIFAETEAQHSANAAKLREAKENGTSID